MRVCHVITRLIVGGAQENTVASVLGMMDYPGIRVNLLSGPSHGPEGSLENRFEKHPGILHIAPELVRPIHPVMDLLCLFRLRRWFNQHRPDIVHTHSGKAGLIGRLAAKSASVPLIIHTIHGPSFGPFQHRLTNLVFQTAERLAGRYTDFFVVVANAMKDRYLKAGIGHEAIYQRVFSGFNINPFLKAQNDLGLRKKLGLDERHFVVGKIARLFKLKGHDDLIEAAGPLARRFDDIRFLLVGDGIWRSRLQEKIRGLGLENRFVFTGLLPPEEVPAYVGIMDALVHLSTREGLPRALPQALAAGKPVVAYDCDGAAEVCIHGQTGFLVPPSDREALGKALEVLRQNESLRRELGERGREFVHHHFPEDKMVEDLHTLYMRLLKSKGYVTKAGR